MVNRCKPEKMDTKHYGKMKNESYHCGEKIAKLKLIQK